MAAGLNIKRNSRIFHIANECYIIYLGVKTDEERPFLRVGNTDYIDDRILDVISNTVVSARFTGNPLYELKLDRSREINYIGDTAVIERMKTYLNSFQLPSEGAVDYHQIKDREQRDVVYFYNNGNIRLNYKDEPIFDLYKRSESDRHFVQQCDEIKKNFARNPIRYTKHDFRDSGIVLSGDSVLLFNSGRFYSAALGKDYFSRLAASGIDPDQVAIHYSTIKEGEEAEPSSHALIEMLKRSSYRNSPFTIHARNPEYARKISALFPGAIVAESTSRWSSPFSGLKVREGDRGLDVECSGFPTPLSIGDGQVRRDRINLNPHTKTLSVYNGQDVTDVAVPDGILCNIKGNPPSMAEMTELYISRFVPLIKGFSPEDDYNVAVAVQKLIKMLASVVDGDAQSGLIMRSSVFNFSDLLKSLNLKTDSILTFFLRNSMNILDLALARSTDIEGKLVKNIQSLQSDIKSLLVKSAHADLLLPVAADIYTGEMPGLYYRSVKSTAKKADYQLALEIAREILSEQDLSPRYYSDEKQRLLKLIGMLESATDLEVEKLLEKQKPAEPYRAGQTETGGKSGKTGSGQAGEGDRSGPGGRGSRSGKGGKMRNLLLLLLIPVLLLSLWGVYKGVSWFASHSSGSKTVAIAAGGQNGTVTDSGTDQSGGNGTDGTENPELSDSNGLVTPEDQSDVSEPDEKNEQTGIGTSADGSASPGDGEISGGEEKNTDSQVKLTDSSSETDNREVEPGTPTVSTDSRPSTAEEAKAYLNVGDFHISLVDIHLVSNRIAVDNNYRDLDYQVYDGADPDWIYPGNRITLPDGTVHNVVRGDTIWYMAARYIRTTLDRDIPVFERYRENALSGDAEARSVLEKLMAASPCEAFREKIHEVLKN